MLSNPDLKRAASLYGALKPYLQPRNGYYGGRCEVFKLLHQCSESEKIHYFDFCGLYPYIMITSEYYVGMPTVIRCNFGDIKQYRGLVFGRFLPPAGGGSAGGKGDGCFLPVLPTRIDSKLYFTLCATCAKEHSTTCSHNEDARTIQGVYTTEEISLALDQGYLIKDIFEIWSYPPNTRDSKIFNGFVKLWMKVKAENSGFPADMRQNECAQDQFIAKYRDWFSIELDKSKIKKNPTLRTVAKLAVNSLHGKLGQRLSVCYTSTFDELRRLTSDPTLSIQDIYVISKDLTFITYRYKTDNEPMDMINLPMRIQTTSYARMTLWKALSKVQALSDTQILYTGRYCLIVTVLPFESADILGDLKDEIFGDYSADSFVSSFTRTGPKAYSYKVQLPTGSEKTVTRLKGFRLDSNTAELITPEVMREMVTGEREDPVTVKYPNRVVRNIRTGKIRQRDDKKAFCFTSNKSFACGTSFVTYPYGFFQNSDR